MKTYKLTKTITLAALSFVLVSARADITTGLVGWWSFDNADGVDRSANSLTGQLQNGPIPVSGRVQGAMRFVGANNYMVVPHNAALNFASGISISFWLKADYWTPSGTADIILDRRDTVSNQTIYGIHQQDGQLRMLLQAGFGSGYNQTVGVAAPPVNQWIHITATWSGSVLRMYVNGVSAATSSTTTSGSISTLYSRPMLLARTEVFPQNGAAGFKGVLDEVRIYNRALSASDVQELYGLAAQSPTISSSGQPKGVAQLLGLPTAFSVTAGGPGPLSYQWWKDSVKLTGKTASSLSILSVAPADAGYYSVVVSNPFGSVTSKSARLAIPGDPTAGVTPPQVDCGPAPVASPGKDSLVFITHGWRTKFPEAPPDFEWVNTMATVVNNQLIASGQTNWDVFGYNWATGDYSSYALNAETALHHGETRGNCLGQIIRTQAWSHVHLIGHSAGSALIQGIADALHGSGKTVHTTFLDPFLGTHKATYYGRTHYGTHATWSENYFAHDITTKFTEGKVNNAHNVEVTWLDPQKDTVPKLCAIPYSNPSETSMYQCGYLSASSRHEWPHEFYLKSVTNGFPSFSDYGFVRSKEGGGWDNRANYAIGNNPKNLGDLSESFAIPNQTLLVTPLQLSDLPKVTSGNVSVSPTTLTLMTASPAWISLGLTISNQVNAVVFDAAFTNGGQSQGLLSVYWDTNEVGIVDERVAGTSWQTYTMPLPFVEVGGVHLLGLRLDPYTATDSSLVVTNVQTAWITTQDPTVSMAVDTNSQLPMLTLNGFPGAPYLVESSTNLVNWTNLGVFSSSNTSMHYVDHASSTNQQRFYRARAW